MRYKRAFRTQCKPRNRKNEVNNQSYSDIKALWCVHRQQKLLGWGANLTERTRGYILRHLHKLNMYL